MTLLLGRKIPRQLHADGGVEIAGLVGMIHRRHAMTLQPEHLAVLGAARNLQAQRLSTYCFDLGLAAEHRDSERHGDPRVEILAFHLELRMRRETNPEIEITRLRPRRAMFTLAGDPHTRSLADPGGNPDVDRSRAAV